MELFDSHCHLDSKQFDIDRDEMLERARRAGVKRFVTIGAGGGLDSARRAIALAETNLDIWAAVGIHPQNANHTQSERDTLATLATHSRVVAIGETGLDYHHGDATKEQQRWWFEEQVAIARSVKKPLVIHCRDAAADCLAVLQATNAAEVGGVFHCFSESAAFAAEAFKINFYVSFPGIVTFKNATQIQDAAKVVPLERMLIETDAPYLAPVPYRGKRNESSFMVKTAEFIAQLRGIQVEELASATTKNALSLFNIS